ncbi:MAG TPA: hypothetical protein VMF10_02980 [Candidatus Aquilonibacter sp.]|nr:hypothetical protein [Candidatus Aquilonibacter sp.]
MQKILRNDGYNTFAIGKYGVTSDEERFNCLAKSDALTIVIEFRTGAPFRTWSWAVRPEKVAGFRRANEIELGKTSKSATLCDSVSQLLFGERIETENKRKALPRSAGMAELADAADSKSPTKVILTGIYFIVNDLAIFA